jgi:hypothetical protein
MEVVKMMMKPLPVLVDHYHWMIDWFCFVYVVDTKQKIRIVFFLLFQMLLYMSDIVVHEVVSIVRILPYMVVVHVMTFVSILHHNI